MKNIINAWKKLSRESPKNQKYIMEVLFKKISLQFPPAVSTKMGL